MRLLTRALAAAILVAVLSAASQPAQCSLFDYRPAKMALNKIQQSLMPARNDIGGAETATQAADNVAATVATQVRANETSNSNIAPPPTEQAVASSEPPSERAGDSERSFVVASQGKSVKLDTSGESTSQSGAPQAATTTTTTTASISTTTSTVGVNGAGIREEKSGGGGEAPIGASGPVGADVLLVSSTSAADSDPTSTVVSQIELGGGASVSAASQEQQSSASSLPESRSESGSGANSALGDTGASLAELVADTRQQQQQQPPPQPQVERKSAEEAVRETELEAVAAVDASIGFGGDLFSSLSDSCYDEYGNARFCEPEFENVAFDRQVEVSSECGKPPSRFCTAYLNERNDLIRNCHICDAQNAKKRHPASYLTDLNNSNNPTCWVSAPISAGPSPTNQTNGAEQSSTAKSDNVTLQLNLDKKYEITYISMQFCSIKPDSLAIFKSMDFGRSWLPYQFYSSQCRRFYGRQARATGPRQVPASEQLEASCLNASQSGAQSAANSGRIAFSTLDGRSGSRGSNMDKSQALQDWITATNIRIVLDRHQVSWIHSNLAHAHHAQAAASQQAARNSSEQFAAAESESSLTSPSDTFNYAMSDLTVGGRCKCNGHASRCIHAKEGRLQCDCRHNTAGRDCEKCAPFHFDRPWARASQLDANPCQPCNCNGHSRKCRFDAELYRLSGRRSGGVCIGCRDNTAGRYCHYCREGFTRDHSRPMSDKEACKHCDCHPIGSLGRVCNQTSGQCPCKEGVAGLQCNRCAAGYQQSSSLTEPCIKPPENDINYEPSLAVDGDEHSANDAGSQVSPASEQPSLAGGSGNGGASDTGDDDEPAQAPRAPSSSQSRFNRNKLDPADQMDGESMQDLDKDDERDSADELNLPRKHRLQNAHWSHGARKQNPYYRYQMRQRHHFEGSALDEDDDLVPMRPHVQDGGLQAMVDDEYQVGGPSRAYLPQSYAGYSKQRFVSDYNKQRSRPAQSGRQRPDELLVASPIASLDSGPADEMSSLDESSGTNYLANSVFSEENFSPLPRRSKQQTNQVRQQAASRQRFMADANEGPIVTNELACGDCQLGTRRLGFRQFCHIEYAIKATILNKLVAEDWTRFDVEIQDIFKSLSTDAATAARSSGQSAGGYFDNMVQADEADAQTSQRAATNKTMSPSGEFGSHRLKVGTVQSIWVPTEDLACKCPRLKLRSTYLLMGSIDAKETSANLLQLDRHGIALEWRSSLQEKLVKYQRRYSRGRC